MFLRSANDYPRSRSFSLREDSVPGLVAAGLIVVLALTGCGGDKSKKKEVLPPDPVPQSERVLRLDRVWSTQVGGDAGKAFVTLAPALSGTAIMAASPTGRVISVSGETGKRLWERKIKDDITAGVGAGSGLALVVTDKGEVVALDSDDGAELWRYPMNRRVLAAPVAEGDLVVVQSIDGQVVGLHAGDGTRRWSYGHVEPGLTLRGTAQPLLVGPIAVTGFADGLLVAINRLNGELLWEIPVARPSGQNEIERLIDADTRPLVAGGVLYAAVFQGRMVALDIRDGRALWTRDVSTYQNLSADSRHVYAVDAEQKLQAIERLRGDESWTAGWLRGRRPSGPAAAERFVAVGDGSGYLYLIDNDNGQASAQIRVGRDPVSVAPIIDGDRIYVQTTGGALAAYRAADS